MMKLSPKLFALAVFGFAATEALWLIPKLERRLSELEYPEDAHLTVRQLIDKYEYHGETHEVVTEDGYILEMHRITGPKSDPSSEGKQPILLIHPLLSCSADWILIGPGKAFGYILADEGYDVWMGNVRGNRYSLKHKNYTTMDKEYWQFSWHEIGLRDLPAMIDYILENTSKKQLIYAGHSQGTTAFWVMASERPEYQNKVKAMFALAPVAYLTHTRSPFYHFLAKFANIIDKISSLLGFREFQPMSGIIKDIAAIACKDTAWTQSACRNTIFLIAGFGSDQLNATMLPVILGHIPAGASVKQVIHYLQVVNAGKFQQYNHGIIGNLKKYKQLRPPVYDLSKIRVPVSLHYGQNDALSVPTDVKRLYKELPNPIGIFKVPHDKFTHLDFVWAKDGKQLLYDEVIDLMRRYKDRAAKLEEKAYQDRC